MNQVFKSVRKLRGLTQDEAAELIGVKAQQVGRWERGEYEPDASEIDAMCEAYNVTADQLLGRKPLFVD